MLSDLNNIGIYYNKLMMKILGSRRCFNAIQLSRTKVNIVLRGVIYLPSIGWFVYSASRHIVGVKAK